MAVFSTGPEASGVREDVKISWCKVYQVVRFLVVHFSKFQDLVFKHIGVFHCSEFLSSWELAAREDHERSSGKIGDSAIAFTQSATQW